MAPLYLDWKGKPLFGVAKFFRRDILFDLGRGKRINLYQLVAGLKENQRTAVFPRWPGQEREGKIVFWYVRLRPHRGLDYPLMGVIKVELPNPSGERIESDLADQISRWLLAERTVTPLDGTAAGTFIFTPSVSPRGSSKIDSEEVLKAAIRWPKPGFQPKERKS